MANQSKIDKVANNYNKTKDSYYRDLWYKMVEDMYGFNTIKQRIVSSRRSNERDDSWDRTA